VTSSARDDRTKRCIVTERDAGKRIDVLLAELLPDMSRARVRRIIDAGGVLVSGKPCKPSARITAGEVICVAFDALKPSLPEPKAVPLDVLYEDANVVVVNKPPRMVVHPGKGAWSGTLVAALAHHFQSLSTLGGAERPGIVHRLDRDTSGVIVVAKRDAAHERLAAQFKARTVEKTYVAIVSGAPDRDRDWIDRPIGDHPHSREKKAIRAGHASSRDARTFYEVVERFCGYSMVRVQPKTGRTHQIRLHLMSIGCPVLCDKLYGGRASITRRDLLASDPAHARHPEPAGVPREDAVILSRQALHAAELSFDHPTSGARLTFAAPLPADIEAVLGVLHGHSH
jgi:23S rRNA pseudouridine1911/1915/1917 synthase